MEKGEERKEETFWTQLPPDLLEEIGKRLESRLCVQRFRSVCNPWRSSLPLPTRFPLRVPPLPCTSGTVYHDVPYFIAQDSVFVVDTGSETESDKRFLVMFEEVDQGGKFRSIAFRPSEQRTGIKFGFPEVSCSSPDDQLSHLSFVAKSYHLRTALPRFDSNERVEGKWDLFLTPEVLKVVLISSNANRVDVNYANESDLTVVAHLEEGKLALFRLEGYVDWNTNFCNGIFEDIISYNGKLYAVDPWGRAFVMDYNSLAMRQVAGHLNHLADPTGKYTFNGRNYQLRIGRKRLVEAFGDIYLLDPGKRYQPLKVYKLRLPSKEWLEVEDLGNQVLVVGSDFSFAAGRDIFFSSGMMKCTGLASVKTLLFFVFSHRLDEADCAETGFSVLPFSIKDYNPWRTDEQPPTITTTTSSILSKFENTTIARTNFRVPRRVR